MLDGRVAIVTGANSGVGYGCAARFADEGAHVIACDRVEEGLHRLVKQTQSSPGSVIPLVCDVGLEKDLDRIVEVALTEYGKVDILACIAQGGMKNYEHLLDTTRESALESFSTGPLYTMQLMQKCFPVMKAQGFGRIITCASGNAVSGTPGFAAYGMAKGAIMALTRGAAKDWGQYGITTNCFLPVIEGGSFNSSPQGRAAAEQIKKVSPVGYLGKPYEDCAPILAFIASDDSHYMNGQMVGICGGIQMLA